MHARRHTIKPIYTVILIADKFTRAQSANQLHTIIVQVARILKYFCSRVEMLYYFGIFVCEHCHCVNALYTSV